MKLIEFTRGENPFKTLKIGKKAIIKNWFETWAPDADYEIDDDLNICVKGWLDLENTNITFLPDNLYIKKFLNIEGTKITSLPNNLHIRGWLNLRKTKITFLPDNLHVGGTIYKDF